MKPLDRDTSVGSLPIGNNRMGKIWWLNLSYDHAKDEFFAYVDDGAPRAPNVIYQIDDTQEMIEYIQTGRMKHIDDVESLTKFLIEQGFIEKGDAIRLNEVQAW